jgi:GNAT superfamily N-acetyltransferase
MGSACFGARGVVALRDGRVAVIRRADADDGDAIQGFIRSLSPYTRYQRFMVGLRELPPSMLDRILHADPRREAAVVAQASGGIVGLAQFAGVEDDEFGEVALVVGEDWRRARLATHLLHRVAEEALHLGFRGVYADILRGNGAAIALARRFDVELGPSPQGVPLSRVSARLEHAVVTSQQAPAYAPL